MLAASPSVCHDSPPQSPGRCRSLPGAAPEWPLRLQCLAAPLLRWACGTGPARGCSCLRPAHRVAQARSAQAHSMCVSAMKAQVSEPPTLRQAVPVGRTPGPSRSRSPPAAGRTYCPCRAVTTPASSSVFCSSVRTCRCACKFSGVLHSLLGHALKAAHTQSAAHAPGACAMSSPPAQLPAGAPASYCCRCCWVMAALHPVCNTQTVSGPSRQRADGCVQAHSSPQRACEGWDEAGQHARCRSCICIVQRHWKQLTWLKLRSRRRFTSARDPPSGWHTACTTKGCHDVSSSSTQAAAAAAADPKPSP